VAGHVWVSRIREVAVGRAPDEPVVALRIEPSRDLSVGYDRRGRLLILLRLLLILVLVLILLRLTVTARTTAPPSSMSRIGSAATVPAGFVVVAGPLLIPLIVARLPAAGRTVLLFLARRVVALGVVARRRRAWALAGSLLDGGFGSRFVSARGRLRIRLVWIHGS